MARASGQAAFAGLVYVVLIIATAVVPVTGQVRGEPEGPPTYGGFTLEELDDEARYQARLGRVLRLVPGVSNEAHVRGALGEPDEIHRFGQTGAGWGYGPSRSSRQIRITFGADSRVNSVVVELDDPLPRAELLRRFGKPAVEETDSGTRATAYYFPPNQYVRLTWWGITLEEDPEVYFVTLMIESCHGSFSEGPPCPARERF